MKKRVLFLCTHNSSRSQIAEAFLRNDYGDRYDSFSAGTKKKKVNPDVIEVMRQIGIDMSFHFSKTIDEFKGEKFDFVVTVCDNAKENCPFFPGDKIIHHSFKDPSKMKGDLVKIALIRDEIKDWIQKTFG